MGALDTEGENTVRWIVMALVLTCVLVGCGKPEVVYLPDSEKVHAIKKGEPSPIDGYVLPSGLLFKLYREARTEEDEGDGE